MFFLFLVFIYAGHVHCLKGSDAMLVMVALDLILFARSIFIITSVCFLIIIALPFSLSVSPDCRPVTSRSRSDICRPIFFSLYPPSPSSLPCPPIVSLVPPKVTNRTHTPSLMPSFPSHSLLTSGSRQTRTTQACQTRQALAKLVNVPELNHLRKICAGSAADTRPGILD